MPPQLALVITLGFIAFLFRRDFRQRPPVSGAVWLPLIWTFLIATRPVSKWLVLFGIPNFASGGATEGSSLDATVFLILTASGIFILSRRRVSLYQLIQDNRWLTLFILYCFAAVFWSDFSFVSFKRWIKILGHPVMAMLLFSESHWEEAFSVVVKRCAYVVFPISILWFKYFPNLGRHHDDFGAMSNVGIAGDKNQLGGLCLVFLLLLLWHLLKALEQGKSRWKRSELRLVGALMVMGLYCLAKAHSATAAMSLVLGAATMVLLGSRFVNKRAVTGYLVAAVIVLAVGQLTFDLFGHIVELTGHESTLEGRGRLWEVLLQTNPDPIFGAGFESYWLGRHVEEIWAMPEFWWHPNQAHNGYLEVYLNLGIPGFCIFAGVIFATFNKIRSDLLEKSEWGRFELGCLLAILVRNWTEAGFKGLSLTFLVFFIISIRYRHGQHDSDTPGLEIGLPEQTRPAYVGESSNAFAQH